MKFLICRMDSYESTMAEFSRVGLDRLKHEEQAPESLGNLKCLENVSLDHSFVLELWAGVRELKERLDDSEIVKVFNALPGGSTCHHQVHLDAQSLIAYFLL